MPKKTILLTGATGFLGSHLTAAMVSAGYEVVILKRSFSDTRRIHHLLNKVSICDLDRFELVNAFRERRIDVVVHASTDYGRDGKSVDELAAVNLMFPLRLLVLAGRHDSSLFINIDTSLPRNLNAYTLSKKQFLDWLRKDTNLPQIMNLKIEHMYGPGDDENKFVHRLIALLCAGTEQIPLTDGTQQRDFIYVDDVVRAIMLVIQKRAGIKSFAEFEVGSGTAVPVKEVVNKIKKAIELITGREVDSCLAFGSYPMRPNEPTFLRANTMPLNALGWKAMMGIEPGIQRTVKEYLVQKSIRSVL